ncbi:MAG: CRISPR-associated protein, large subunit of CASCADE complex, Cas8b1 [Candidatus Methanohalarchaeum thermophilum]|uniref:CRISPR-associated protein, large subunit of CASCADE complex, Cas8b1 n=1 Tax=Methanohalarchaeum thermophilum TaxID=1903181 RepID=A0A1Q6DWM4_METT1|nr:MAG: CRISPR-associated protein, large subunit of CASCADE complex, Cas8b1 [Candidatus Methanohalarchaeum thermophilum]
MISNLIKLGRNTEIVPFSQDVSKSQKILEMELNLDENNNFYLSDVNLVEAGERDLFYIQPTKTINSGKNRHYYPHDFTLGGSAIGKNNKIENEKIHRNFNNTKDFYLNLDLKKSTKEYLEKFYSFVLKDESKFIEEIYEEKKSHLIDLSKSDLRDLIFVFKIGFNIIDRFNLNVNLEKDYYYLGEIKETLEVFKKFIPSETSISVNNDLSSCSFCGKEENLFSPTKATFYYSFTFDQKTGFYGLNEDNIKKQLIICDDCFGDFNKGKKFIESYLQKKILGVKYFSLLNFNENKNYDKLLESFKNQNFSKIYSSEELKELRKRLNDRYYLLMDLANLGNQEKIGVDLFFYVYDNGIRVVKFIKDIYPNRILELLEKNEEITGFSFNGYLIELFSSNRSEDYDLLIKQRIGLLEKILLDTPINYDHLQERFINKISYKLRNQGPNEYEASNASNFTKNHIRFLELLSKLNCNLFSNLISINFEENGADIVMNKFNEEIKGESGLEKMENFISENKFFAETPEIRTGIPLGVTIARLSYEINNYEKRMLGYARKRINDKDSLRKFINEVEEKATIHEISNQPIVSSLFNNIGELLEKENFSENDFIFGMFIGYSLSDKFTNPDTSSGGNNNE